MIGGKSRLPLFKSLIWRWTPSPILFVGLAPPLQSPLNAILHACLNSYLQYYKDKKIILRTLTVSFSIMLSFSEIR